MSKFYPGLHLPAMPAKESEIKKQLEIILAYNRDPLAFLQNDAASHKDFSKFKVGPASFVHAFSKDLIKHVLQTNHTNYSRSDEMQVLKVILGNGLPPAEGEAWLRQRRSIQPFFNKQHLAYFAKQMALSTEKLLRKWEKISTGVIEDLHSDTTDLTLDIITRTLFSDISEDKALMMKNVIETLIEQLSRTMQSALKSTVSDSDQQRLKSNADTLISIVREILESRKKSTGDHYDILNMLMNAVYTDTKQKIDDQQIIDESISLLLTGLETTASTLTFALYLIYTHPAIRDKFYNEIKPLNRTVPSAEELKNLSFTNNILSETMRLYPPLWNITRKAINNDKFGDLDIQAGDTLLISPYVMHRSKDFWENPDSFIPDRFSDRSPVSEFVFFPFGRGPRICVGSHFAVMSMTITLSMIGQRFILTPVSSESLKLNPLITLRPKGALPIGIKKI